MQQAGGLLVLRWGFFPAAADGLGRIRGNKWVWARECGGRRGGAGSKGSAVLSIDFVQKWTLRLVCGSPMGRFGVCVCHHRHLRVANNSSGSVPCRGSSVWGIVWSGTLSCDARHKAFVPVILGSPVPSRQERDGAGLCDVPLDPRRRTEKGVQAPLVSGF